MKRFMKGCAITALIFWVTGMVLAVVGGRIAGDMAIARAVEQATKGKVRIDSDSVRSWGRHGLGGWILDMMDLHFDGSTDTIDEVAGSAMDYGYDEGRYDDMDWPEDDHEVEFSSDKHVFNGDVERFCPGKDIRNLDIDIGGCWLQTADSPDGNLYLEAEDAYKFQGYVDGDTLYVKSTSKLPSDAWDCRITLYLPRDYRFHEVEVELGAGQMDFGTLYADSASLEVGAGQITVYDRAEVSNLEVSVGVGSIDLGTLEADELEVEVGMGAFVVTEADIRRGADVNCSMGSVDMTVRGRESDFNYELECAMGAINLGEWEYAGLGQEKKIDNGASREVKLECSMGYIDMRFME